MNGLVLKSWCPDPEISDEQISGICVFEKGEGCGGGVGVTSQGHYNSLCSHHSCGVFMSDGLFGWIGFLGKRSGLVLQHQRSSTEPARDVRNVPGSQLMWHKR